MRAWLRIWLGIEEIERVVNVRTDAAFDKVSRNGVELEQVKVEVARLKVAQYVPPSQAEPERKVIRTQTFKQFSDIVEQEFAQKEE